MSCYIVRAEKSWRRFPWQKKKEMYNGIGLRTARGSGTNGYVQSNKAYVKPVNVRRAVELNSGREAQAERWKAATQQAGNAELLAHAKKREVEVQVFELRDRLEEEGLDEDTIEERCSELRGRLSTAQRTPAAAATTTKLDSHAAAETKRRDDARLREALGIRDHVEGQAFDRELQERLKEERKAERDLDRQRREAERQAREREEGEEEDDGKRRRVYRYDDADQPPPVRRRFRPEDRREEVKVPLESSREEPRRQRRRSRSSSSSSSSSRSTSSSSSRSSSRSSSSRSSSSSSSSARSRSSSSSPS